MHSILHISNQGLPDWRIEKSALSSKKRDHKVCFAGLQVTKNVINTFDDWYALDRDYKARYHYTVEWVKLKRQLSKIIVDCKPDFIHGHNIFAAELVKETNLDIPFIYDNHVYWSRSIIYQYLQNDTFKKSDSTHASIPQQWRKWELDIKTKKEIPMIVPSKVIAEELSYFDSSGNIFLVPNYPCYGEIKNIPKPIEHDRISSAFTNGGKPHPGQKTPIKNIDGFFDIWNDVNGLGHLHTLGWLELSQDWGTNHGPLSRSKLYNELCKHDLGIIPWKYRPFHPYCSPNRAYEYSHAGLVLIISPSLESVFNDLEGRLIPLKDYKYLNAMIQSSTDAPDALLQDRIRIQEIARTKLIWENYEGNIFDAYNKAMN